MVVRTAPLFPLGDQTRSYPGSVNVDLSHPGRVSPAFDHAALSGSTNVLHYFGAPFVETTDADGNPIAFAFANLTVWKIQNGAIAVDNTFSSGGVIQGLLMVDNGSGTRVLMATFGTGGPTGTAGNATRDMSTGTWTSNTGATKLTAYSIAASADQLAAATGSTSTGRTATIERKIAICPIGSDPTLAASWSTAQAVWNDPTWQINAIAVYEERFCVGGPIGFFIRDQQEGRWKNMTNHVRPHGVNGKVTVAGENCVWYATQTELFRFDGRLMHVETPFRGMERPRDMPQGRVTLLVDNGDRGLAVLETWPDIIEGKHAADAGLRVFKEDGGVITELTSSCLDGSMATAASMASWGATTTDYLVFGFPRPLAVLGVRVLTTAVANTATQSFTAPETLNGSGSWVGLGSIRDATILSVAGKSLQVTGFPASSGESIIGWDEIDGIDQSGVDTYNGIGGLYWYRVASATATGMTASGTPGFHEAFAVEARPGLPHEGLLSQSTNFTGLFRSGGVTRVLEFIRQGGRIIWQDKYHLVTGGGVFCGGLTASPAAGGNNSGRDFVLLGRFAQMYVMEGRTRDATQQKFARLAQITSSEPAPMLAVYNVTPHVDSTSRLSKVRARGVFVQEDDAIQCVIQTDEWKVYNLGVKYGSNAEWDASGVGELWRMHVFLILKDTTQLDPAAPWWGFMEYDCEATGRPPHQAKSFPTGKEAV